MPHRLAPHSPTLQRNLREPGSCILPAAPLLQACHPVHRGGRIGGPRPWRIRAWRSPSRGMVDPAAMVGAYQEILGGRHNCRLSSESNETRGNRVRDSYRYIPAPCPRPRLGFSSRSPVLACISSVAAGADARFPIQPEASSDRRKRWPLARRLFLHRRRLSVLPRVSKTEFRRGSPASPRVRSQRGLLTTGGKSGTQKPRLEPQESHSFVSCFPS